MVDNEQFAKAFKIETARARDFQSIASVAFLIAKAPSQIMPTIASLEKWLNTEVAVDDKTRDDILESFTKFISLVLNPKLSEPIKRGRLSPAEFIMICYFMSLVRKSCADEEISKAIGDLRDDVRRKHEDIRTNSKVFKTMFTFVNNFQNSLVDKTSSGQRAKRKRDSSEDVGPDRKPIPHANVLQLPRRVKLVLPSAASSQRTSQNNVTDLPTTPTPDTSSRPFAVLQSSTTPQKPATPGPQPINTASSRPTRLDPLAVVEAAKRQAGRYNRSGKPCLLGPVPAPLILCAEISGVPPPPTNTQPNLGLARNTSISQPVPPPPPSVCPPRQPPPPPNGHYSTQPTPPPRAHNPNQYSPHPGYAALQSQAPPPTPTRDPRRPQGGDRR